MNMDPETPHLRTGVNLASRERHVNHPSIPTHSLDSGTSPGVRRVHRDDLSNEELPFFWRRRQFPVRPAFAMTINKSQGQTLKSAGIFLPNFQEGQPAA